MLRRLDPLLLLLIIVGILYTRSAWAESDGSHSASVMVRASPLSLLIQDQITVKVGEFSCDLLNGPEPASVCSQLPPGEYEVSATSAGYFASPASREIDIASDSTSHLFFNFYENNHQLYIPDVTH
jgi:hypothetical protein